MARPLLCPIVMVTADAFWALPAATAAAQAGSNEERGLDDDEAARRALAVRARRLRPRRVSSLRIAWGQVKSPLMWMLVVAALISFAVGEHTDAIVIVGIVLLGSVIGFTQERGAARASEKLVRMVASRATVVRGGREQTIAADEVVPGDVVLLAAGALVPGDCRVLVSRDLHVDEATLTGETFPVEKDAGASDAGAPLARRRGALFFGTHVVSGTGRAVVVHIGADTELGRIAGVLAKPPPPSDLERGVERFGVMIAEATAVIAAVILAANVGLHRPILESFLYSLALAVGIVPELLPAIVGVNLARGARRMARRDVIVKRLSSIEDFGSIDVLCSDKTGTLTEGSVRVDGALDLDGAPSDAVLRAAIINATFETGLQNPVDDALRARGDREMLAGVKKLDEAPYDFVRKRLSVLVDDNGRTTAFTKGAVADVLAACTAFREAGGGAPAPIDDGVRARADATFGALSARGARVLGVATREVRAVNGGAATFTRDDEHDLVFLGFIALADPPKAGIQATLAELRALGVGLKIITGDNRAVAATVARGVGMVAPVVLTGEELRETSDSALARRAEQVDVFAEVEPNQKARVVNALRRAGHIVGYIGDGINDAPALHAAHVGISVNNAADVAKEAAHVVLLKKDLGVLVEGVKLGRATLANTLKYVYITSSANFGNMLSMAAAGFFLPFLPLLPKQILLNNLLSDIPMMGLAADRVDEESLSRGRRWDPHAIRRFMIVFGAVSSVFDVATFFVLRALGAGETAFQSAWFLESVLTELFIVLVMRTARPLFSSRPSAWLIASTAVVAAVSFALPYFGGLLPFGLVPLSAPLLAAVLGITLAYTAVSEVAKRRFFRARRRPAVEPLSPRSPAGEPLRSTIERL